MIEFVDIDHAQELDAFVTAHEWSHFMQTSLWGRVKSDWGWHGILCRGEDGKIRGTMAILQHNIHYTNTCLLYAPRGPIFDHTDFATFEELIAGARELAKRQKAYAIRIDPMFEEGSRGFMEETEKLGFTCNAASDYSLFQPRMTYVIDLTGLTADSLLANYTRMKRYDVRRAIRSGVTVRMGGVEDIPEFCRMMASTAERRGFAARSKDYFTAFLTRLGEGARMYLAEKDGKIIAGTITMELGNRMWHMYGCSDRSYHADCPNELLQYTMQCHAIEQGLRWYDFRGVNGYPVEDNPQIGLHRYKQGFGAQFHAYVGQLDLLTRPVMGRLVNLMMRMKQ